MNMRRIAEIAIAACVVAVPSAFAQSEIQDQHGQAKPAVRSSSPTARKSDTKDSMTVVGCLVREADYRRTHGLGKGALGGLGLGDEFVLVNASASPAPAAKNASANCEETAGGQAYRLTGKTEDDLKAFVGHRIEVTGAFDHERDAKTAAGQTNAKLPAEI